MLRGLFSRVLAKGLRGRSVNGSMRASRECEAAEACARAGKLGLAEVHLQLAIQHDSGSAALHYNLGLLRHNVGDIDGASECYRRALRLQPDQQSAHSSLLSICDFSRQLRGIDGLDRHRKWASTYADPLTSKTQPHANSRDPGRRLRVGYVSADFRDHVIGQFIHPVLAHHDRRKTTIFVYSASTQEDVQTRCLKTLVHSWRNIADMDDEEATELIRADSIGCLVDLSGHSAGNRLLVFARKPAPVQLTWMGYLNTTGMSAMDYKVTDQIADLPGADVCYREKLMRLPSSQWCYSQEVKQPEAADSNIRTFHSRILLGCAARFMKINDDCIDLWIEVLRVVGNADLRLIDVPDHPRTAEILERFSRAGFSHRVSILPTLRGGEYWQRIKELDIALDPFPYTGATTTWDCLWMGVPVVTLAGAYGAERSAASILSGIYCEHLIAGSRDEYVQVIRSMESDRFQLADFSAKLCSMIRSSTMCNAAARCRLGGGTTIGMGAVVRHARRGGVMNAIPVMN